MSPQGLPAGVSSGPCRLWVAEGVILPLSAGVCGAQVVVMRLPVDSLVPFIPQILEGILLWCEDSKNKFRLKVSEPDGRVAAQHALRLPSG